MTTAAVELATAYVSLAAEGSEITKAIGRAFNAADKVASDAGRDMGKAMAKTFASSKPDVSQLAADYERAQAKIKVSAERNAKLEENLARKVEIAQAKKSEAV